MTRRDDTKARRKHTDRVNRKLRIIDGGAPPPSPGYVIHHPRAFNPSPWCQSGMHDYIVDMYMNIPILKCRKCGVFVFKGPHEGTETFDELRNRHIPTPEPNLTDKQMVDKIARMMNHNPRR